MARPDQRDVAFPLADEFYAAQDESPHQNLAQLGISLHQREQPLTSELNDFACFLDPSTRQGAAPGEQVHFAEELPGLVNNNNFFPVVACGAHNFHFARSNYKEFRRLLSLLDQYLSASYSAPDSMGSNPGTLGRAERGKQFLLPFWRDGCSKRRCAGHGIRSSLEFTGMC